jgi:hypothetical protein
MTTKFENLMDTIINALPLGTEMFADRGLYPDTKQWAQGYKERALEVIKDGEDVQTFIDEWTQYAKDHGISLEKEPVATVEEPSEEVVDDNSIAEIAKRIVSGTASIEDRKAFFISNGGTEKAFEEHIKQKERVTSFKQPKKVDIAREVEKKERISKEYENKLEHMKVTKLKDLCRKAGVKNYNRMKKQELIDALVAKRQARKAKLDEAKKLAKDELGRDFDRAFMFWKKTSDLKYFTAEDYSDMVNNWKLLTSILSFVSGDKKNVDISNVHETAIAIAEIFGSDDDISTWTPEECTMYIMNTLEEFKLQVFSEKITKEQHDLIKIGINDIVYFNGSFVFDNNRLYNPTTVNQIPTNGIPLLATSEDGISRILKEQGIDTISVEMAALLPKYLQLNDIRHLMDLVALANEDGFNIQPEWLVTVPNEAMALIEPLKNSGHVDLAIYLEYRELHKFKLLMEGFYTTEGKHYVPAFQSPSANRQAVITFVLTTGKTIEECREQVQNMWLEVTGIPTWEAFLNEFCDKNGEVVMAKVVARIATRGSNSFSLDKIAPDLAKIVRNFNVYYAKDTKTTVHKVYKTKLGNGLSEIMEKDVEIVDGDGQGQISFTAAAYIAAGLKIISRNDLDYFLIEWTKIGKDASKVQPNSRLDRIIKRIPAVFQIRHGEKKGLLVRWNLEAIEATRDIDVIIPDSVRKFIGGEWCEYPLEVCNFLKKKEKWAYLNPQFISALEWENPNALIEICKHWEKYELESIHNIAKAQQFHGMAKAHDDEGKENATNASNLVSALRCCSDLIDDFQVINWRKDQYRKFNDDMKIGRLMVPGMYTYMVFDPTYQLNKWFGLDLPCLASKEFYHNGKECEALLARAPEISPYESQRVQLVNNENYKYLANTVVFNGFDGTADVMGGGDFDGDICEIVCDDTILGKIIVNGIRKCDYQIWSEPKSARKVKFTWNNLISYWATDGSTIDRTGVITNYATRALDIANHLVSCVYFAKLKNCEYITFVHPRSFGKGLGCNVKPYVAIENNKRTWVVKGLAECKLTKKAKATNKYDGNFKPEDIEPYDVWFPCDYGKDDTAILGRKSFEEVMNYVRYFLDINEILRSDQGDEIDGAKTGFHPEILDFCKVTITAAHMLSRQEVLDRDLSVASRLNMYQSLSPLGRVHDYSVMIADKVAAEFDAKGSNKIFLLQSLLTEKENKMLNMSVVLPGGKQVSLIDYVADRKKAYNKRIYNASKEGLDIRSTIRENEIFGTLLPDTTRANDGLYSVAEALNITPEVMAVACYIATYTKDSKQGEGLSFGWLLFDELLSVFSRCNKKFELFKLPASVEKASILNGFLYINGNKYREINAEDCENVVIRVINDRPYALIQKICDNVTEQRNNVVVNGAKTYTIGTYGFKYHIAGDNPKDEWKNLVRENGFIFDITMDATNRAVISINGKSISALMPVGADFDLMNKKVKVVNNMQTNPIDETNASIKNLQVVIIDDAQ